MVTCRLLLTRRQHAQQRLIRPAQHVAALVHGHHIIHNLQESTRIFPFINTTITEAGSEIDNCSFKADGRTAILVHNSSPLWRWRGFLSGSTTSGQIQAESSRFVSSTSTSKPEQAVRRLLKRFPVDIGCSVKVDVSGDTNVQVVVGDNMEEIVLEAEWFDLTAKAENTERFLCIEAMDNSLVVTERDVEGSLLPPGILRISIPERWCNVSVHTWEGSVQVASVVEANLEVSTDGGNVKLGKMKGLKASILTNGGAVEAKSVLAALHVVTGGGRAHFQQILGNDVVIDTGNGDLVIDSMYGEKLHATCQSLVADTIKSEDAQILTKGGNVKIGGLDGKLCVQSNGGAVEVQLYENAKEVKVDSGKGSVLLFAPESLDAQVKYLEGGEKFGGSEAYSNEDGSTVTGSDGTEGKVSDLDSKGSRMGSVSKKICLVEVKSFAGNVTVKRRGWFEAAAKMQAFNKSSA